MSAKNPWKTFLMYGGMILLGIACGFLISALAGGRMNLSRQPVVAYAAEAAPAVVISPDSPEDVYNCTPAYIAAFSNRIHVRCTVAAPGGIYYFSTPTSDSKNANRALSIILTAKSLGKNLRFYYYPTSDGSSYGCQTNDCRPFYAVEMLP